MLDLLYFPCCHDNRCVGAVRMCRMSHLEIRRSASTFLIILVLFRGQPVGFAIGDCEWTSSSLKSIG